MVGRGGTTQRFATALAALALVLAVSGCAATSSAASPDGSEAFSAEPSSSEQASSSEQSSSTPVVCAEPTTEASPSLTPALTFLPPGSRVRVVVDGLCFRAEPSGASEASLTVPNGAEISIDGTFDVWGPVVESGIAWYPAWAGPFEGGWVAGEHGGARYLELVPFDCPADRATGTVLRMTPWERLSCFGTEPIELSGVIEGACQGGARPETSIYEPEWLAKWCMGVRLSDRVSPAIESARWMEVVFSPSFEASPGPQPAIEVGDVVRVVGHFDDPAATSCRVVPSLDHEWSQPAVQTLCREQFVVTDVEVLGHMNLPPVG